MKEQEVVSMDGHIEPATERLFRACERLNLPGVRQAIGEGADIHAIDQCGRSVVEIVTDNAICEHEKFCACVDPRVYDVMKTLLENGARPDGTAGDSTPLETFVHYSFEVSQLLVEHGAKVNFTADGEAIIDHVVGEIIVYGEDTPRGIFRGYAKTLEMLEKHGALTYSEQLEKKKWLRKMQKKWRSGSFGCAAGVQGH